VNGLQPVIDRSFPLAEIAAAFESYQSQSHFGKLGIDIWSVVSRRLRSCASLPARLLGSVGSF